MSKNKTIVIVLLVVVALALAGWARVRLRRDDTSATAPTFAVARGPLLISVMESGTIKAREQIIIKNEVEGRTSLIYLIPEGTVVQEGDLLVELDASALQDTRIDQEIRVQNAEAAYINAKEDMAVVENQAQSDIELAELTLEFAKQDLRQYQEGEYPNRLQQAEAEITLNQEELIRAQERLKWSQTLFEEKYLSQTELQADQLAQKRSALDVELAKNDLELLTSFTYQRQIAQLESDVRQAEMALERTQRKARANIIQAQAKLTAEEAEYNRELDKLAKLEDQISKTKLYAPTAGLVIYATSARTGGWRGNVEPLEEGQEVREREELIYLPTANSSKAEITIHESNLDKVSVGMPAVVTVDALPGRQFLGVIARIAPLPDAQSMWMNPDLKVYTTEVYLQENDPALRTGMSCQAEIVIERYPDTLYVPVQSVLQVAGRPTVYVRQGDEFVPRPVETGLDNNRMIRIIDGLQANDEVMLTPPLQAGTVQDGQQTALLDTADVDALQELRQRVDAQRRPDDQRGGADTGAAAGPPPAGVAPEGDAPGPGRRGRRGAQAAEGAEGAQGERPAMPELTPEQRQQMRRQFEQMTPEQRRKMREQFEQMTPEQREQLRQQFGGQRPGNG